MIRQWFDTRVSLFEQRVARVVDRTILTGVVRDNWMPAVYVLGLVALSAGIVDALASPVSQSYIIYPSPGGESIAEMTLYMVATLIGVGGLYLSYLCGRPTLSRRLVGFFLPLGLLMLGIAVYIEMYIFFAK
ncbi:MAG: hypothetical protein JRM86_00905 [Nitrososphaerota archaeon]|nr:hypothetical protein [Nitrososphaerota archaeon]MDG6966569.1 hypothetical protein [Nitrososphaerota archaeon]MDG6978572.1 hypothetical protein [Nitrososphaerota archaeon]MDG7005478.1 hypothetical protein [Nitrososphaerota archaeon]MDG7020746.1 hypothetical protein [Nitrososphaerota archaeon]